MDKNRATESTNGQIKTVISVNGTPMTSMAPASSFGEMTESILVNGLTTKWKAKEHTSGVTPNYSLVIMWMNLRKVKVIFCGQTEAPILVIGKKVKNTVLAFI